MLEEFYITVPGLPPSHEVQRYIEEQEQAAKAPRKPVRRQKWPVGYVLTLLLGLALILASSLFLLKWGKF